MVNNQTDGNDEDLRRVLAAHARPPMTMEELVAIAPAAARHYQNPKLGVVPSGGADWEAHARWIGAMAYTLLFPIHHGIIWDGARRVFAVYNNHPIEGFDRTSMFDGIRDDAGAFGMKEVWRGTVPMDGDGDVGYTAVQMFAGGTDDGAAMIAVCAEMHFRTWILDVSKKTSSADEDAAIGETTRPSN